MRVPLLFLLSAAALAQPALQFEVATIKPVAPGGAVLGGISTPKGKFNAIGTLKALVEYAWSLPFYQVSGGPKWASSELFEITAKQEGHAGNPQVRAMLQELLKQRFQLELREEPRPFKVFFLRQGKRGSKMPPANPDALGQISASNTFFRGHTGVKSLVAALSNQLQSPVLDQTGLTANYAIDLNWAPAGTPDGPSLFSAVEEQLGLRLESGKAPMTVLIITRAEHPSAN